jgi:hypothetical protein
MQLGCQREALLPDPHRCTAGLLAKTGCAGAGQASPPERAGCPSSRQRPLQGKPWTRTSTRCCCCEVLAGKRRRIPARCGAAQQRLLRTFKRERLSEVALRGLHDLAILATHHKMHRHDVAHCGHAHHVCEASGAAMQASGTPLAAAPSKRQFWPGAFSAGGRLAYGLDRHMARCLPSLAMSVLPEPFAAEDAQSGVRRWASALRRCPRDREDWLHKACVVLRGAQGQPRRANAAAGQVALPHRAPALPRRIARIFLEACRRLPCAGLRHVLAQMRPSSIPGALAHSPSHSCARSATCSATRSSRPAGTRLRITNPWPAVISNECLQRQPRGDGPQVRQGIALLPLEHNMALAHGENARHTPPASHRDTARSAGQTPT